MAGCRAAMLELCKIGVQTCRFAREVSDADKSVPDAEKHMAKIHSTVMPEGTISNAAFADVLAKQLKPVLEPLMTSRGLPWEPCLPYIKKVCEMSISHRVVLPALCSHVQQSLV